MSIKCYLFTNIARQINHTYYSVPDFSTGPSKFYYHLNDYGVESFILNESFIYEVEIYPETVFVCSDKYLQARKYKIIRYVSVFEYLNGIDLFDDFAEGIVKILTCSNSDYLKNNFYNLFNRAPGQLSPYEKLKFLAILNKAQEFPRVTIEKDYQVHYIKLFEFYKVPYEVSINIATQEARREKIFGNTNFETINNQTKKLLQRVRNDSAGIAQLIIGRKLTQKQFEELCDSAIDPGISFKGLKAYAIISGYKIQPQHERLFYPFIVYHYPEKIEDWIKNKIMIDKTEMLIALENNYMIDSVRYWNSHHQKIIEAKKIFLKDGLKHIQNKQLKAAFLQFR